MRLLHALTLEFESFEEDAAPNYAILSHTWGDDEVTYKDMKKHRKKSKSKAGYEKIERCAALAVRENLKHLWIDTCCIDKSSSAELSEAINSMFRWYRNAAVCFVHLADVQAPLRNIYHKEWAADFRASRWFTRGWTLQELIAPKLLVFYSRQWVRIGTKWDLESEITARTLIPYEVLITGGFDQASVAQRMSWASSRTTSRKEDMAYCLMGLFEVNMPLLYGEGKRAFIRLQEEIIKRSDDMSIFGWTDPEAHFSSYQGLFAESPSNFTDCSQMEWSRPKRSDPFELTNKGIKLNTELAPIDLPTHVPVEMIQEFIMRLPGVSIPNQAQVTVRLQKTGEDEYARVETKFLPSHGKNTRLKTYQTEFFSQTIFVRETPNVRGISIFRVAGIRVKIRVFHPVDLIAVTPEEYWDASDNILAFGRAPLYSFPPKACFQFKHGDSTIDLDMDLSRGWESIFGTLPGPGPGSKDSWVLEAEAHQLTLHVGEEPLRLTAYRSLVNGNAWVTLEVHDPPDAPKDFLGPCI